MADMLFGFLKAGNPFLAIMYSALSMGSPMYGGSPSTISSAIMPKLQRNRQLCVECSLKEKGRLSFTSIHQRLFYKAFLLSLQEPNCTRTQ